MTLNENKPISVGTRLGTMFLDHVIMTFIAMVFFLPTMISGLSETLKVSHEQIDFNFMEGQKKYFGLIGFALYLCKDVINGRSISKRIFKLQVVDFKTGQVATPIKCFIRNIFCILWPVEVIVAMTNTGRRIGDKIAGTKLVQYNPDLEQPKLIIGKLILPFLFSYGIFLLLTQLTSTPTIAKINYIETSYNQIESKKLEKYITDSMSQYLKPDIRLYDSVKDQNLKYLSVILLLNENYIADEDSYKKLHEMTTNLIYSKYPKESFIGQIKYVYKNGKQFQSRATIIGKVMIHKGIK